jgi:hypothetical protein
MEPRAIEVMHTSIPTQDKEGDGKYYAPRVSLKIQDFDVLGRGGKLCPI